MHRNHNSIKAENNTIILAVSIFILFAISILIAGNTYKNLNAAKKQYVSDAIEKERQNAYNSSLFLIEMMRTNKDILTATAKDIKAHGSSDQAYIDGLVKLRSKGITMIDSLYFGRQSDGRQISSRSLVTLHNYDPRKRTWYLEAIKKNGLIITEPYQDKLTNKLCITMAYPVYSSGTLLGVLGIDCFIDSLEKLFQSFSYNHEMSIGYANESGVLLYHSNSSYIGRNISDVYYSPTLKIDSQKKALNYLDYFKNHDSGIINMSIKGTNTDFSYFLLIPEYNLKVISTLNSNQLINKINKNYELTISAGIQEIFILLILFLIIYNVINYMRSKKMQHMLTHDFLTGISNRYSLEVKIENLINSREIKDMMCSLVILDIDNFKFINNYLGHTTGDNILIETAKLLNQLTNESITLYRITGDEFAFLITSSSKEFSKAFALKAKTLLDNTMIETDGKKYDISASLGVCMFDLNESIENTLYYAYSAIAKAKENGKNSITYLFDDFEKTIASLKDTNRITDMIKSALKENRFVLALQPIYDIKNNLLIHYEALIRLITQEGIMIPPSEFITLAEKNGLISNIDRWVLDKALEILKENSDIKIFINLSGVSLADNALLEYFEKRLLEYKDTGLPVNLGIEITETAAAKNFAYAEEWINRIHSLGCQIAIDDFGVGYTSFSYLNSLPVDFVKIDGSFIKDIVKDSQNYGIVKAINSVVLSFGKKTIAEYVENQNIKDVLLELNIDCGQGYGLGMPTIYEKK